MAIAACGYQWIAIGTYRGPWMLMDGHCCLWRPIDANGWLLVLMETYQY